MLRSYLEVGEYTFDLAVVFFGVRPILSSDAEVGWLPNFSIVEVALV